MTKHPPLKKMELLPPCELCLRTPVLAMHTTHYPAPNQHIELSGLCIWHTAHIIAQTLILKLRNPLSEITLDDGLRKYKPLFKHPICDDYTCSKRSKYKHITKRIWYYCQSHIDDKNMNPYIDHRDFTVGLVPLSWIERFRVRRLT